MDIKRVNVLGQIYKVKSDNKKVPQDIIDSQYGHCDRDSSYIWINEKLSNEQKYRTLFHEMGHSVVYRNGVAFSGALPMELEEILVETFASMQYEFLRDLIKGLMKYEDIDDIKDRLSSIIR
tara:strand:+ start:161 stop:526 length:366 start_codon:yes stop_codon:yes gene_type:complete